VFERVDVKKEVFTKLDAVMKAGALLLTNSSAIDTDIMAGVTKRPQDVAGAHFFAPANVMKLYEVVKGTKTSIETIAGAMKVGRDIGKISAVAGTCDGFAANRSRAPFITEMMLMLEEGALPEQVDKVMVDFGYPIGPFAVADLSGLDIGYDTRKRRAAQYPNYRKLPIADRIVEAGHALSARKIVKDEIRAIRAVMRDWTNRHDIDVIVSTGGTGLTGHDVTVEAMRPLFEKEIEGFATLFHVISFQKISTSTIQSRATAGIMKGKYTFCLPGSPGACKDGWDEILNAQLDFRHRACNFVEIMPRLEEHLKRVKM